MEIKKRNKTLYHVQSTSSWQDNYNYSDAIYTLCKFCYKDVKDNTDNNNRRINL